MFSTPKSGPSVRLGKRQDVRLYTVQITYQKATRVGNCKSGIRMTAELKGAQEPSLTTQN